MKKKILILGITFIMAISMIVVADPISIDLSSMSLEELVELRNEISQEINSRISGDVSSFGNGTYIVGVDIKSGTFKITNTSDDTGNYYIYASVEDQKNGEYFANGYMSDNSDMMFNLHEGEVIKISGVGSMTIEEVAASWAP